MRKIIFSLILVLCAITIFAQDSYNNEYIGDFEISGEIKTGIIWSRYENQLDEMTEKTEPGNKDDASIVDGAPGRYRLNFGYFNRDINVGFKFRLNWERWTSAESFPAWHYAFGYAKFFDDQLTMSLGRLGDSPWGTGGPEMWAELEFGMTIAGIRFEIEPNAVPGLNIGFVLNGFDGMGEPWGSKPVPLYEYLAESVIGASYTFTKSSYEWFHVRTAVRLDSQVDGKNRDNDGLNGIDLIYRFEEYALNKIVPDLKFWAMGYIYSIGASEVNEIFFRSRNWLFVEYDPSLFTAQIRFGLDSSQNMDTLYIKPSFYFTPWNELLKIGVSFEYTKYLFKNDNTFKDSPYHIIEIKPLIQYNLNSNAYAAIEYAFRRQYQSYYGSRYEIEGLEPIIQNQYINIRVGVNF